MQITIPSKPREPSGDPAPKDSPTLVNVRDWAGRVPHVNHPSPYYAAGTCAGRSTFGDFASLLSRWDFGGPGPRLDILGPYLVAGFGGPGPRSDIPGPDYPVTLKPPSSTA
jgi:hypothetical protein